MSLFGSIQLGANTLQAMQIGLQVVGNNIANSNTPGFVREQVNYSPASVQRIGNLQLGLGVQVDSITQVIDKFLQGRLLGARSDRAGAEVTKKAYQDVEVLIGELGDRDLSSSLSGFFNSVDPALAITGDLPSRNLTVLKGKTLTQDFNRLRERVVSIQSSLNDRIVDTASEINNLAEEIRILNLRISTAEGGGGSRSQAGGIRNKREAALTRLSEIVDVQVNEQPSGGLSVSIGGQFLVFEGQKRVVEAASTSEGGTQKTTIQFADSQSPLNASGGELQGLYSARDEAVGGFLTGLDDLVKTLAFEFNKIHSQGQGLIGFQNVTAQETVFDTQASLDAAGLNFTPVNGTFDILVRNTNTGLTETRTISVDLDGLDNDTSLVDLANALSAVDGITASISATGKLSIQSDAPATEFSFARDSSGVLAALGINTFFTGSTAADFGVNSRLDDERLLAFSLGGIGTEADASNGELMAAFYETKLEAVEGNSIADLYSQIVNDVTQGSAIASSIADGFGLFEATLEGEQQAVSGVSVDEEAIRMILLQRTFQAAARHIQTVSEMLDVLVAL